STSTATILPCGPEPKIRVKSMPRSPAKRRASGVTVVPLARFDGPKFGSGVRTALKGSIGAAGRGIGVEWTAARGAAGTTRAAAGAFVGWLSRARDVTDP